MKKNKIIFSITLGLTLSLALGALLFSNVQPVEEVQAVTENVWHVDTWSMEDGDAFIRQTATFAYYSEERLMERAALVVYGRAIGRSEPFFIENIYSGARAVFTDYLFEVYEVFRGEIVSREVIVRVEGGITDEMILIVDYIPEFERGREYILFLTLPGLGPFDAPGEYYHILGGLQGVFPIDEVSSEGSGDEAVFVQYRSSDIEFELPGLRSSIAEINDTVPIDSLEELRDQGIENLRISVAEGVFYMTEEEIYEVANVPLFPGRIVR